MKNKRTSELFGRICIVLVLIGLASGLTCFAEAAESTKPVIIGGITPLTGPAGLSGVSIKQGADLAVDEYNAKGGILGGRKVVVKWEDDKNLPSQSVSALRKHIASGIRLITGLYGSSPILADIPVAKENGCILVNATGMHPKTAGDGVSFSMIGSVPVMQIGHAEAAINRYKFKTVFIVADNTDYGRNVAETVEGVFKKHKIKVLGKAYPDIGQTEFRTLLTRIKQLNPDIFWLTQSGVAARVAMWEQAVEVGVRDKMVCGWEMLSESIKLAPREVCEGIWGTTQWAPTLRGALNEKFLNEYAKKYKCEKHEVSDFAATGWQAAAVLLEAVKRAGTDTDIEAIRKEVWATDIEGLWGRIRFDPAWGRPFYTPVEFVIHNKAYKVIRHGDRIFE